MVAAFVMTVITATGAVAQRAPADEVRTWHNNWTVVLPDDVPVGGWVDIVVRSDGTYRFRGSLRASGPTPYDFTALWLIVPGDGSGAPVGFEAHGHLAGADEPGSPVFAWDLPGTDDRVADVVGAEFRAFGKARTTLDLDGMMKSFGRTVDGVQWVVKS
jgi:hypothetical protein